MIICALLLHYTTLKALPEYRREFYIQSNTNTCKVYSKGSWSVVEKDKARITISNGVVEVQGYLFKQNKGE
jgi:hypothetical protein